MTTTLSFNNVSDYNSRIALVKVAAAFPSNVMRRNPYTIKVPVSRLSQTLQRISRAGGKVQSITIQSPSYGEVNSGVSSPELRVVDVPANSAAPSSADTEQVESVSQETPVEHHHTETTANIPVPEETTENPTNSVPEAETTQETTDNQTTPVPEAETTQETTDNQTTPVPEAETTEETTDNQITPVPEIDSEEYAANIGGNGESKGFMSNIGAKLTQITKTNKSNKKTTGKQDKKSKRKRKN
ncbi:MAG: phycobilisome linker polypeptide [Calothrix sp. MO_167.B42]|nr:phycobilisome linker polypeptide [Calothrix sp. MO_167.B42]